MRVFDRAKMGMGVGLLGLLVFMAGCGDGVTEGTSNVTPATPPPGRSAADQATARGGAYPAGGAATKKADTKPAETPAK
jgi:hypothetical protein